MFMARPFDKLAEPVGSAAPGQHFQRVRPERSTFAVNYAIDFARRAFDFEASQTFPGDCRVPHFHRGRRGGGIARCPAEAIVADVYRPELSSEPRI